MKKRVYIIYGITATGALIKDATYVIHPKRTNAYLAKELGFERGIYEVVGYYLDTKENEEEIQRLANTIKNNLND